VKVIKKPSGPDNRVDFVAWPQQVHTVGGLEILNSVKPFRISGAPKLFLRHELLKVEDVQASVPRRRTSVEEAPWRLRSLLRHHGQEQQQRGRTLTCLRRAMPHEEARPEPAEAPPRARRLRRLPDEDD
jgi:hypothetical protein